MCFSGPLWVSVAQGTCDHCASCTGFTRHKQIPNRDTVRWQHRSHTLVSRLDDAVDNDGWRDFDKDISDSIEDMREYFKEMCVRCRGSPLSDSMSLALAVI